MTADAIEGRTRSEVLTGHVGPWSGAIGPIVEGSWRGKPRGEVSASGYVAHALEAAVWSVGRGPRFFRAVLHAANLGQDADTTAAIAGQLAGALSGSLSMPAAWIAQLAWRERLQGAAEALL